MIRATWKYIFILVTIWLLILGYMGWQLLSVVEDSNRNVAVVLQKERQLDLMKSQNEALRKKLAEVEGLKDKLEVEIAEIKKKNVELERKLKSVSVSSSSSAAVKRDEGSKESPAISNEFRPPSREFLITRRRAEKTLKELWYFVSSEITKVNKIASDKVQSKLRQIMGTVEDMHHLLSHNFENLKSMDGQQDWAEKEHKFLSDLVQRRLRYLQHPKDCNTAKKLVCQLNKGCGYGCQVHHLMYCFIVAYGLERTLIVDSSGWRYSSNGWTGIFKPVSETCTSHHGHVAGWSGDASKNEQNVLLPIVDSLFPRPKYMPLAVPKDLASRIEQIHGHPFVWWIGQFAKYLFRYAPQVQEEIDKKRSLLGFKKPIVG